MKERFLFYFIYFFTKYEIGLKKLQLRFCFLLPFSFHFLGSFFYLFFGKTFIRSPHYWSLLLKFWWFLDSTGMAAGIPLPWGICYGLNNLVRSVSSTLHSHFFYFSYTFFLLCSKLSDRIFSPSYFPFSFTFLCFYFYFLFFDRANRLKWRLNVFLLLSYNFCTKMVSKCIWN